MRRFLRTYLPHPDKFRNARWFRWLGGSVLQPALWHLSRHTAPGAVAIGLFCGLIPGPLQMIGAALLCVFFRRNLPLALVTTLYSNPLTIIPLYLLAFKIGALATGSNAGFILPPEPELARLGQSLMAWGQWMVGLGKPLAIGLILLASILAALGYVLMTLLWRWHLLHAWHKRKNTQKRILRK